MLKKEKIIEGSLKKSYQLHVTFYEPEDRKPTKILHIIHGMTEHMGRYEKLADILAKKGILVVGFDLRGHGKNNGDQVCASFGEGGWQASLEDIHILYKVLKQEYSDLPYFMLGFSLGSFLLREYLNSYSDDKINGSIIMGTGYQPQFVLNIIMKLIKKEIHKVGYDNTTSLVRNLSFGQYNKKFKPNRTASDWLCSDNNQLDIYINDELCRKDISAGLFYDLLLSMKHTGSKAAYDKWDKEMSILLISGTNDPVGDMSKGILHIYETMKTLHFSNVKMELIEGVRHDLLHEEASGAADKTIQLIDKFINS